MYRIVAECEDDYDNPIEVSPRYDDYHEAMDAAQQMALDDCGVTNGEMNDEDTIITDADEGQVIAKHDGTETVYTVIVSM